MFVHLGVLSSVGIFIPHITKELGIGMSQVSLVVTFATGSAFICSLFASRVIQKISAKTSLYLATTICALHYVLFGFTTNVYYIWLGGVMAGFVMGFGTNVAIATILSDWFIEKRATVLGIVFGGSSFGGAITMFIAGFLIEHFGWRKSYFIMAFFIMLIGCLANFLLIKSTEEKNQLPLGADTKEQNVGNVEETEIGLDYEDAKKSKTYVYWWIALFLGSMTYSSYTSFAPSYWQAEGMSHLQSSSYVSLLSLLAAVSIMMSGRICDKLGIKAYLFYPLISFVIGTFLFVKMPNYTVLMTIITVVLIALSAPTSTAFPATVTPFGFGLKDYVKIQGHLMVPTYLGKAVAPILLGQINNITGSMRLGFTILGVFAALAFVLLILGLNKAPIKTKV